MGQPGAADDNPSPIISKDRFITEWGFYTGAGYGQVEEGPYVPIFFILYLGLDTKRWLSSLQEHRGTLSLFIEPQINPSGTPQPNIEFGVGLGVKYSYPVTETFFAYIPGSVGPHYITLNTEDQAKSSSA